MDVIVTGANGFVGHNFCSTLNDINYVTFDRNSNDINNINDWVSIGKKEIVIFLAGITSITQSWEEPYKTYTSNTQSLHAALEYCRKYDAKLIFFSSFVYKIKPEGFYKETDDVFPYNPYALSKLSSENLIEFYAKHFDVDAIIFRPFNIYGPGQDKSFIIPHLWDQFKYSEKLQIQSTSPIRDYIYIDDIISALHSVMNKSFTGLKKYNLSTGVGTSVGELITLISNKTNIEVPVEHKTPLYENSIHKTIGDNTLFKCDYNWEPKYTISKGLDVCKEYYF